MAEEEPSSAGEGPQAWAARNAQATSKRPIPNRNLLRSGCDWDSGKRLAEISRSSSTPSAGRAATAAAAAGEMCVGL